jgi:hypothetical protein
MKKNWIYYTILIVLMIFSSCSNNDDSNRNNDIIIGKWRTIEIYESNVAVEILACTSEFYTEFKSNNTVSGFRVIPNTFPDPCNQEFFNTGVTWENLGNSIYKFDVINVEGDENIKKFYKDGENLVEESLDGVYKKVYEPY